MAVSFKDPMSITVETQEGCRQFIYTSIIKKTVVYDNSYTSPIIKTKDKKLQATQIDEIIEHLLC